MSTKECPSCGNIVEAGQAFCPMCGSKLHMVSETEKKENKYLKDEIAKAEAYASSVLYTKSKIVFNEVNSGELNFLAIIDKFPSEPEAYIAYVNYMTKYIDRVIHPQAGDAVVYFNDLQGMIDKCKLFLEKALNYSNTEINGSLLQEISRLQGCLDSFKLDETVEKTNQKNKNKAIWGTVGAVILFALLIISFVL